MEKNISAKFNYEVGERAKILEPALDLKNSKINSMYEFQVLCKKLPDFRTRESKLELVRRELQDESQATEAWRRRNPIGRKRSSFDQLNLRNICQYECEICEDKHYHSKPILSVREYQEDYQFVNPFPLEMKELNISEVSSVDIDWRMLTSKKPGSKVEENMFTRLVQLDRLTEKSRKDEILELFGQRHSGDPDRFIKLPSESRGGVTEVIIKTCEECGEEYCYGDCRKNYQDCQRSKPTDNILEMTRNEKKVASKKKPSELDC